MISGKIYLSWTNGTAHQVILAIIVSFKYTQSFKFRYYTPCCIPLCKFHADAERYPFVRITNEHVSLASSVNGASRYAERSQLIMAKEGLKDCGRLPAEREWKDGGESPTLVHPSYRSSVQADQNSFAVAQPSTRVYSRSLLLVCPGAPPVHATYCRFQLILRRVACRHGRVVLPVSFCKVRAQVQQEHSLAPQQLAVFLHRHVRQALCQLGQPALSRS